MHPKKSSRPITGLWNREPLKILNDPILILNFSLKDPLDHLESIWDHSEPSEVPYSANH